MRKTLLDTDIFSEILKKKHLNVNRIAQQYYQQFGYYTISTITVMEIVKGFHKIGCSEGIERLLRELATAELVTLTQESAALAGKIYADLERSGEPIGRADPMIAAIALEEELVLATGNERHYQRIQHAGYPLELTNWKVGEAILQVEDNEEIID